MDDKQNDVRITYFSYTFCDVMRFSRDLLQRQVFFFLIKIFCVDTMRYGLIVVGGIERINQRPFTSKTYQQPPLHNDLLYLLTLSTETIKLFEFSTLRRTLNTKTRSQISGLNLFLRPRIRLGIFCST